MVDRNSKRMIKNKMTNEKIKEKKNPNSTENAETVEEAVVEEALAASIDAANVEEAETDSETEESAVADDEQEAEPEKPVELIEAEETITRLEEELEAAQKQAAESLDRLQRTAAEFQNSRRRQDKVVADSIERASVHLIRQLLPLLDDFDLAFRNTPEGLSKEQKAWADGFRQIQKKLMRVLEEEGVTTIAQDGVFDPERHEAVSSEPNDAVESNHIIETLRTGYEHKNRVLRPALVRVAM